MIVEKHGKPSFPYWRGVHRAGLTPPPETKYCIVSISLQYFHSFRIVGTQLLQERAVVTFLVTDRILNIIKLLAYQALYKDDALQSTLYKLICKVIKIHGLAMGAPTQGKTNLFGTAVNQEYCISLLDPDASLP